MKRNNFSNPSKTAWLLICGLLIVSLAGCLPAQAGQGITSSPVSATPTQVLPATVLPSATPTPTDQPTKTPVPEPTRTPSPEPPPEITLLFTGQIVPGRCVEAGVQERGEADSIYDAVRPLIEGADLAVATVNGTISEFSPKTGCVATFVLTGSPVHADAIQRAGFDAASVATNHIKNCNLSNCGNKAFFETLDNLRRVGVVPIGAGENLEEGLKPVYFDVKGVRFGIVSLGEIEPLAFAGEDTPGIGVLSEENLRAALQEAGQEADVVIAMPHWGPEYTARPNWNQLRYARIAVEAGADLVVGNHTHVVQAVQEINGVPVFYGLGNFVFDQAWSTETTQSVILVVRYRGTNLENYELIPVVAARDGVLRLADDGEAAEILGRIEEASRRLPVP
jgi:poly-gamma-glutamate capsule biosynthesis protein CapA/YwtB (metallophosphatase superfamily)